jgi:hypothetical protein
VLLKAPPQCLASSQQAVVGVRQRNQWKEGEGLSATWAATAPDLDPVVMLVVRLLASSSVAGDRIAFTNRASPRDDFLALFGPVSFDSLRWSGKWDKQNRMSSGL